MFRRVAIVNRGEPAMRLIHAVRELSAESASRIETVALSTDVDRNAAFVREADLVFDLGPAAARPYTDLALLERALIASGADAAWPGWGFVAEDPAFAELCERIGVTFVGPSPEAMRLLGDKIGAKLIAEESGVPVAPWSGGPVKSVQDAIAAAARIGYPLMLKAAAGGGGRGIRRIDDEAGLVDAFERTGAEAARAFGSGVLFLEQLVTGARHIEAQVIADGKGTAWVLGVRDCSVQRRNQKVIEESASPLLTDAQVAEVKAAAERLALRVGYRGAATVEFLYHHPSRQFTFLEVNTRLQVEHPVTEATTGFDLVKAQLSVAAGGTLDGVAPAERGHAVEARLNAEDPDRGFAPAPGRIALLKLPAGPGIRVDTGVAEGDTIPAAFDSMIAKIVAHGRDRGEALGRLRRALAATCVVIEGGTTNKTFVLELLNAPEIVDGSADTGWIDRVRAAGGLTTRRHSAVALAAAAIDAYEHQEGQERARLLSTAAGGRPQVRHRGGGPLDLTLRGAAHRLHVARVGSHRFRVGFASDGPIRTIEVRLERFDRHTGRIVVDGEPFRLVTAVHGPVHLVEVDGVTHRVGRDEGGVLRSPAPALVIALPAEVGTEVEAGAPVVVLESMKMETVLRAPFRARVRECPVGVGSQVGAGEVLLRLTPLGDSGTGDDRAPEPPLAVEDLDFPAGAGAATANADELRSLLLGYDVDPHDEDRVLKEYLAARAAAGRGVGGGGGGGAERVAGELALIEVFADLAGLTADRPGHGDLPGTEHVHSAREHFHLYLQSLDADRAGLPDSFRSALTRAFAHYGVSGLERTTELEAAVFRVFLAHGQAARHASVVAALLREWLNGPVPAPAVREPAGPVLESLIAVAQRRFPPVADLARGVVYAWFGLPLLRQHRALVYANVRRHLRHLDENPQAPDRDERIAEMVRSTEPLVRLLGQRLARPGRDNSALLEVLTRRYYGNKGLSGVRSTTSAGTGFVVAQRAGSRLVSAAVPFERFGQALDGLAALAAADGGTGSGGNGNGNGNGNNMIEADVYLLWESQPEDPAAAAAALQRIVEAHPLPDRVLRVTATVAGRRSSMHHHVTFRRTGSGLAEDRLIRGLHPHLARLLQLEQYSEFDLTRVPSSDEEVYLYRCVARANPVDDRLIAFTQIRDLTELRGPDGRLAGLPAAENALAACLDSIRRARAGQSAGGRPATDRIVAYVWPPITIAEHELRAVADRVLASSADTGLEEMVVIARHPDPHTSALVKTAVTLRPNTMGHTALSVGDPVLDRVEPLDEYRLKVLRAAARRTGYPYELTVRLGEFTEHDLDDAGALVPVSRPRGRNTAGIVAGVVRTRTARHADGITRVVLLGDPTKSLGALSEPECRRVVAALDLAERMRVPVEWYALSAGARISMTSGTENMDWVAVALKRIVEFTQGGGEINIIVAGITVGAQPYWNAEATMLMHTRGVLIMTPDSAMVLTGKQALDFSGGVSAEDNFGIGGYDRIMGPNGQAQYWAPSLAAAREVLMAHYDHTYVVPGETAPRRAGTDDPFDRDISSFPHTFVGSDFTTVGEIFSAAANPDRKKAFDIRTVMRAVSDQDHPVLERWAGMADAETAVVQDARLGGIPVCLVGIESRQVPRRGFSPADGPEAYTAGTLFPQSSKKVARAVNAASGNRPLVVLANLSGFDGSPESMRKLQLEYGAEIGRAIVNFQGPIVFCVISRYHGGAFVVFSKALNPNMTVLALEGSFASVLGGAPAAAVVFSGEVDTRTAEDSRIRLLETRVAAASGTDRAALTAELDELRAVVRAEKLGAVAAEFDRVHSIRRAVEVGSVDEIVGAAELRPRIIEAIERRTAGA